MPPKKKGKKKKTIEPIVDPETLRIIGTPLQGTELLITVQHEKLGGQIEFKLNMTEIATVADMYELFWRISGSKPGTEYVFCGSFPKLGNIKCILLGFDAGKSLKDHLGLNHGDTLTFIECGPIMKRIYVKERMKIILNEKSAILAELTGNLVVAKREKANAEDISALEEAIQAMRDEVDKFTAYMEDPALAIAEIGTYNSNHAEEEDGAPAQTNRKPFKALPAEEQQRLAALKKSGLDQLKTNRDIAAKLAAKEAAKGKKKKKKK